MAYIGTGVEYALHCLLWLVSPDGQKPSSRDLADIQGVPPAFIAKIMPKLEKAGIVAATGGIRGGYCLARTPEQITVLDVVDAVEGHKALFDCKEVRTRCALYGTPPPEWANRGICGIHSVMLRAEKALRAELAKTTLGSLSTGVLGKGMPPEFIDRVNIWFDERQTAREEARMDAIRARTTTRHSD